jgi:prophage regulatory protein
MNKQFLQRPSDLAYMTNRHISTIYRWIKEGLLPKPLYIGNRLLGWKAETIESWLSEMESNQRK